MQRTHSRPRRDAVSRLLAVAFTLVLAVAACRDLTSLDQQAPSRVVADRLFVPANAQLLVTSAIGDFECALTNYILAQGLVGDELADAQLSQAAYDYDRRTVAPTLATYASSTCGNALPAMYTPLSIARYDGDTLAKALAAWTDAEVPGRQSLLAQAAAYTGYSLVLLAEGMCTAAIDVGPELTRPQLAAEAETRFTTAIAAATAANDQTTLNMARVGRARSRLDQGKLAEAKADAILVPDGFVKNATYSAVNIRRENAVSKQLYVGNLWTVEATFRNLTFAGAPDPRVSVTNSGLLGTDRVTAVWRPGKYPTTATPIPIATWREARLIEAEANLATNDVAGSVAAINKLHAAASIAPYGGGTAAEVATQLREERRRELFLEGHRLNDMIRFGVPLSPAAGTAFPVRGGFYGSQLCFPLPDVERNNNPNTAGKPPLGS